MKQEESDMMFLYLGMVSGTLSKEEAREYLAASIRSGDFNPGYLKALQKYIEDIFIRVGQ